MTPARQRLFVTGASSFVGAWFCRHAADQGHAVFGLRRHTPLHIRGVTEVVGDVRTSRPPPGTDVVVHLAAKVMADDARAQNRAMMDAVLEWGLPVVYASSTVVHWPAASAYREARIEDEARLAASPRPWLVVRPCAPYGPPLPGHTPAHTESFHRLARLVSTTPLVPIIGDGRYRRQPVHVEDFNHAILALLERNVWRTAFDAGASAPLTMRELLVTLAAALGRSLHVLPVPARLAALGARAIPGLRPELIANFATDDVVDPRPLQIASGVPPRSFSSGAACLRP